MKVDRLDLRILRSLSRDGRKPYKAIAEELDVMLRPRETGGERDLASFWHGVDVPLEP